MANDEKSDKIIWTADCIATYLGVSRNKFYALVKAGLPAVVIDGTWCAHEENLDLFFKQCTRSGSKNIPMDAK